MKRIISVIIAFLIVIALAGCTDPVTGDLDGNRRVDSGDAIYLLYHIMFPDDYSVNQPVDYNGDGKVNNNDAIYLMNYTMSPDDYPLNQNKTNGNLIETGDKHE